MIRRRSTQRLSTGGFTLIELLVVVAIIAIIALIALPNYLEAQTRAKVSRARADLRTVVTGLEAYAVDWNSYPTYHYAALSPLDPQAFYIGGKVPAWGIPDPDWDGRNPLTTPIAYLTTFPNDQFSIYDPGEPEETRQFHYVNWPYAIRQAWTPIHGPSFEIAFRNYGPYRLHSRGPDLTGPESGTPYDPTNGTLSQGDIIYGPNTGFDRFVSFALGQPGP